MAITRPPEEDKIPGRCNALTRRGTWCTNRPVQGRTTCRMHGGASPRGKNHPSFTTGRYSKHVPARLMESYVEALQDPDLIDASSSVALLDARVCELLGDSGGGRAWRDGERLHRELSAAIAKGSEPEAAAALGALGEHLAEGAAEARLWREIRETLDDRRRQVDVQRRLLETRGQLIAASRVVALLAGIEDVVHGVVRDRAARERVAHGIQALLEHGR